MIVHAECLRYNACMKIVCATVLVETSPQALPLGASCIASSLKADDMLSKNADVELVVLSNEDKTLTAENFACRILGLDSSGAQIDADRVPQFVCMSIYVWNRKIIEQTAEIIKKNYPGTILIAGGPEVTANPFTIKNVDYTSVGQGEYTVTQLIRCLVNKTNTQKQTASDILCDIQIPGVYTKKDFDAYQSLDDAQKDERLKTLVRSPSPSLESLPSPYLDGTLDPEPYGGALWELARGCPFKCSYCYESKGENKIHYFPQDRLQKEIELFAKKNIAQVFVLDPTYNADKKRALSMLRMIREKAPGMFFYFEARAEFIDREMAKSFASIQCSLQIGLQSSDEKVLDLVNRTFNKKQFIKNVGILNEEGVNFGFDLIYGLPGDSLHGFRESIDFATGLYPNNIELFCLSVLPGTDLYERATCDIPSHLTITFERTPPYHVIETPTFSALDLQRARQLALATNLFYTAGRAVPWFMTVIHALHVKPSVFFTDFSEYCLRQSKINLETACTSLTHKQIEEFQIAFVSMKFEEKKLNRMIAAARDLIKLNGALSRLTADGVVEELELSYHPDDLCTEYATDLAFFTANAKPYRCKIKTIIKKSGPGYQLLSK